MKYHISVKFLAFFLAVLSLFSLLASAGGIIGLTAMDLYKQSVDQLYHDTMQNTRQNLAMHLVHQYASLNLGKLPENYFYEHWGSSWMNDNFQYGSYFYTICDENGKVVASTTQDMPEGTAAYIHVVTDLSFQHLIKILSPYGDEVSSTEASEPGADKTDSELQSQPAAVEVPPETPVHRNSYFDTEIGDWVDFTSFIDKLPPYTVTLYLLPGAMVVEPVWDLLSVIWQFRYALFYVLGSSILLFAICAVYLCCAAGRKPGRQEARAEGLNRLPLDLYAAGGGIGIGLLFLAVVEVGEYLVRHSPEVLVPFIIAVGCGACMIFVGFCFACAAQFKTPGGFWWRNTLIGHTLRGLKRLACGIFSLFSRGLPKFEKGLLRLYRFIGRALKLLWQKSLLLILSAYRLTEKFLNWTCRKIGRFFRWLWQKLSRFMGMLPLTWQWLLVGIVMVFFLFAFPVALIYRVILAICIVLYGSHCFGILLESTKRMSQGNLDTKVSDQFLLGSFKEFAEDLNALADVAVVAAQKQLKSERMKTELITNVSHDIKTPLTSIINYVDLLEKPHTEEEGEAYLEVLHRQSQRLKKLVDDLMEMSKASTGNLAVDIVSVDAGEAVNQALGEFADKLERAKLAPMFRQPEEPVYMKADGRLVWRVMSNLLSNAVKYALPGTRLYIDLTEAEGKVIISMKNISREELNVSADELLERFVRGDTSRNTEGSGLGLNIARSLMELQKGQLQLHVDGDLFKVTLTFPGVQM